VLPGPLQAGDLLAGRYLLVDPVAAEGPTVLWRAQDKVLARDVAVRVLITSGKAAGTDFLAAAAHAGRVTHPGLARVFDAGVEERPGGRGGITYLIREWVEGEPLDEHLDRLGPLAPPDATDVLRQVADTLTASHAAGLGHGRLHPRNVLVTPSGRVRLVDAAVAAAVHGTPTADPLDEPTRLADTRDAAALLYALLTGRWPAGATPQPTDGLLPSPQSHGHAVAAHLVRAGVPRVLDHVVTRAMDPGQVPALTPLRTPAALADAADAAVADQRRERVAAALPREPGLLRRHAFLLAGLALVALFATAGWFAGLSVGKLPRRPGAVDALLAPSGSPSPGATAFPLLDLTHLTVRDFDPQGDRQENPDQVRNAIDGDGATAWTTSRYKSAHFGGIKQGVGLLLDLGTVRDVHEARIGFTAPGAHVELRVADTAPLSDTDAQVVATNDTGKVVAVLDAPPGTTARYVLVWITQLPQDGAGWRVGIDELTLS
jgi:hypothetical protein